MKVVVNGLETEWYDWGEGTTLFCLHPLGMCAKFFEPLAERLGNGWRVASFDQRGHGSAREYAPKSWQQLVNDADAALMRIEGAVHLAGFSMGGAIAADLADRHPGKLASLTLGAMPLSGTSVFADRACAVERGGISAVEKDTLSRWLGSDDVGPAYDFAKRCLNTLRPESFDALWRSFAEFGGCKFGKSVPSRTLVLSFSDDLSTPPSELDQIAHLLNQAGVRPVRANIKGAGHMGLLQKPDAVARHMCDFLEVVQ